MSLEQRNPPRPPAAVNNGMSLAQSPVSSAQVDEENEKTKVHRGLDNLEGEIISERYQIIKRIGKGGMGVVYLAQQTKLNRNVCLKVLNPALLDDEDAVGRFEREAKGLSRLQHPNIVTIFDYGRDGDLAYIVMEYAQGETLSKYLKANGALPMDSFLPIAVQILRGIGEAHKIGLIHRDIKPANIVLCELEGEKNFVKILDFGLAKLAQGQEDVTKEQQLVGSASYMAPEQILTGHSDTRTDVYALGVMFYLMLSGKKPFTGSNDNVILYKHVNEMPQPLKELVQPAQAVPDGLCEVIMQCLSKEQDKRPQTANDLLVAMSYALDAPQIRAGFGSVSLSHLDTKASDDAETRMMTPSLVNQPVVSEGYASVGEISNVSSVTKTSIGQSDVYVLQNTSQDAKDRKMLILLVSMISIVVAIIAAAILNSATKPEPVSVVVQTNDSSAKSVNSESDRNTADEMEKLFSQIQNDIHSDNLELAENTIKLLDTNDPAYLHRISQLQMQIDNGHKIRQAKAEVEKENYDGAVKLLDEIIKIEPSNKTAQEELDRIHALPSVVFGFSGDRSKTELFVNDISKGKLPQTFRFKEPGKYKLMVKSEGYKNWEREEIVEAGDAREIPVTLEKLAQAAPVVKSDSQRRSGTSGSSSGTLKPTKGKSGKPGKVGMQY